MMRKKLQRTAILAFLTLASTSVADEYHHNNILIGDRASGMGGAYTAVSDDPGGMYYNPAGIAYSAGKNLSASVNAYSVSNRTYKSVIGGQDWTRTSSTLLPNFFGIIQPVGNFKLGFSYAVPDSNQEDQDQYFDTGTTVTVINFNNNNNTNLFGPSVAVQVNDSLSVGATLYVHKRSAEAILNTSSVNGSGVISSWSNGYVESDEWGVRPIVGVMWAPVDKLSLGLTLSKTIVLTSDILRQSTDISASRTYNSYDFKRKYPYQVTAGTAYFLNSSLLLSGDVSYFSAYDYTWVDGLNKRDAVVNGALGTEYYVNKNWAVRGGLFTDFANTPAVMEGGTNQKEHIDMFGGSFSVSHFTKNTSLTGGGSYKFGSGKSQLLVDQNGNGPIQDATSNNWTLFVSSSYSY